MPAAFQRTWPPDPAVAAMVAAFAEAGAVLDPMARRDGGAILNIVYLLRLIRAHPRDLTHGEDHKVLREHVRGLLDLAPRMIAAAEADAAAAARDGRATDMDHFATLLRTLLAAAQPFAAVARATRTAPGWWHGWAGMLARKVALVLYQHGRPHGTANASAAAVRVTAALLDLAGVKTHKGEAPDAKAVVAALRPPRRARKALAN